MKEFDPMPTECPECGGKVSYGRLENFGLRVYGSGYCYYCLNCGAYIGTHRKQPEIALGIMTKSRNTKKLRIKCHEEEERHYDSSRAHNILRIVLAKQMGIRPENCHFGQMDADELMEALGIMKEWKNIHFDRAEALQKLKEDGKI